MSITNNLLFSRQLVQCLILIVFIYAFFFFLTEKYGRSLNFYSWTERKLIQTIDLGQDGIAPLEIRFLHDPKASEGFVGCAVNSSIFRYLTNTQYVSLLL